MTLIELQYIVTLAQELHFGRAAARCYVSQPTLSMAVRKLENDLGVLLFERNKSGISMTGAGAQIIAQAARVIEQTNNIKCLAEANKDQLSGALAVGVIPTLAPYLLPTLIPQLHIMASSLRLNPTEACDAELRQKLRTGVLDAALLSQPFSDVDVLTQDFFEEPLVVLLPNKHPLTAQQFIHPIDLRGQNVWLLGEGNCLREQVLNIFSSLEETNRPVFMDGCSLETLRHMVAAGLGITIVSMSAANSGLYSVNLISSRPFADPVPTRTITLAWRASFPRHKAIDILRRALQICTWQFTTEHDHSGQGLLVENNNW